AVIGPIYSIADIFEDPQYQARDTITTVDDPNLGRVRIQNAIPRLVDTPGQVRHLGGKLGQHNAEIFAELGHDAAELQALKEDGVI
nr:CoA transferase [Chloroflexota bacterium]